MRTMRLYRLTWDGDLPSKFGYIDGNHSDGSLPGVTCHVCGSCWASSSLGYPGVDLSSIPDHTALFAPRNVTVPVFEDVRRRVFPLLPEGARLLPGTKFGTVSGKVVGTLPTFFWLEGGLLIQSALYESMISDGLRLPEAFPAKLVFAKNNASVVMLELNVQPIVGVSPKCLPDGALTPCSACGRVGIRTPVDMIVKGSTVPRSLDLFQTRETCTKLATESFRKFCLDNSLSNITFMEVGISDEQ